MDHPWWFFCYRLLLIWLAVLIGGFALFVG
jgi:hypothetical protein